MDAPFVVGAGFRQGADGPADPAGVLGAAAVADEVLGERVVPVSWERVIEVVGSDTLREWK
jgi:hypothetical protein